MTISGIRSAVQTITQRAGAATGVVTGYLMKTAQRESSFNPSARASTSSATAGPEPRRAGEDLSQG